MKDQVTANAQPIRRHWYNSETFPLIPILQRRAGNEHNTPGFTFQWLFLRVWLLDAPGFELSFVADSHWGVGFVGTLIYLRWCFCLPFPEAIRDWSYRNLWRRPKGFNGYR